MAEAILLKGGGGGAGSDEVTATKADVIEGKTAITSDSDDEPITGTALSDATISSGGQMLKNIVAYGRKKARVVGTIPLKNAATYKPTTSNQTITAGQYLNGAQTILGSAGLVPGNIRQGASIFDVAGTFTSNATAVAGDVVTGKTVGIKGSMVTGTLPTMGGQTITPSKSAQTVSCSGKKMTGNIVVNAIPSQYVDVKTNQTVFNNGVCSIITRIYPKPLYRWRNGWTVDTNITDLAEGAKFLAVRYGSPSETYPTCYSFFDGSLPLGNFTKATISYSWQYSGTQRRYAVQATISLRGIIKNPVLAENNNLFNVIHYACSFPMNIGENQPVIGRTYTNTATANFTFNTGTDATKNYINKTGNYMIAFGCTAAYTDNTMMSPSNIRITSVTLTP